jgi:phosphatidylglycerol:prolipoprotein diacylglycerol transferase
MEITRTYISISGFQVYWYGFLIGLGVLAAVLTAARREKLLGIRSETALTLALIVVPTGLIGARLYYVLMHLEYYDSLKDVLSIRDGGLAIYGGLLLGALAGIVAAKIRKQDALRLCDMAFPCVALAQAIGRWGNFLNEEAYGVEIGVKGLQFFPAAVKIAGVWHAAAFFYESVWCLTIHLLICVLPTRKWFLRRGEGFLGYLVLYAFERCAVEGLRTDSLYLGPARVSQLLSALILAACCAYLIRRMNAGKALWAAFFVSSLTLILSASALLPMWALYVSLPVVFALCVFAWLKTRREGAEE